MANEVEYLSKNNKKRRGKKFTAKKIKRAKKYEKPNRKDKDDEYN